MKLTLSTGASISLRMSLVHSMHNMRSVHMAPLGKPVLPEV